MHPLLCAAAVILIAVATIPATLASLQARTWNKGICARHQSPWLLVENSGDGRIYQCRDQRLKISWPIDNPHPKRSMAITIGGLLIYFSVLLTALWAITTHLQ